MFILFIIPSLESTRRTEIYDALGWIHANILGHVSKLGPFGMACFIIMVAIWDGLGVLTIRYAELMVALNYDFITEYTFIIICGKTLGAFLTYKISMLTLHEEAVSHVLFANINSYTYLAAI